MQKTKHWLMTMAMLLCCMTASAVTYSDWTSTNKEQSGSTSSNTYTITANAGDVLTFDWLVSSERNFDWLIVTLNGSEIIRESGEASSSYQYAFTSSGTYTMVVEYTKDVSVNEGSDYAKVYNIVLAENIVASGTCGENLTWKLAPEGKLTIEGTGAMTDFSAGTAPWYSYAASIKSVEISEDVTTIGAYAFHNCTNLTSVELSEGVTSIGGYSFTSTALTSIVIPENVVSIGSGAFEFCSAMTSFTSKIRTPWDVHWTTFNGMDTDTKCTLYVPEASIELYKACTGHGSWSRFKNIVRIPPVATGSCGDNLTWEFSYDGELTILGTGAMTDYEPHSAPWFAYKDEIKTVTIKPGVTTIGRYAIGDCSNLTTVTIPEGVTSIGLQAFQYCYKLTSVTLSDGLKIIDWGAFAECHELPSIDIPEGVTTIGNYAFTHCYKLSTVTIPESVTSIGIYAFRNTAITSVVIPANISSLSQGTFENCPNLASITCSAETPPSVGHSETFYNVNRSIPVYVPVSAVAAYKEANYWNEFTNFLPMGTFGDNLTWMLTAEGELIIEGTGAMTDYSYGNWAPWFDYRESILSINIGEGVTTIGNQTFRDCTNLITVTIPASVTTIGELAFYNCPSLTTANMAEDSQLESIGNNAFCSCRSLTAIAIPATVTSIGERAFSGCWELASIKIPAGMTTIETRAFMDCRKFTSITIPAGVTTIKDGAFYGCENLETVIFSENSQLTTIGTEAFYNCQKLSSIIIPAGVTTMGEGVFKSCRGLISAAMPAGVTTIEYETFESCYSLTSVTFPENSQLTTIGTDAFWDCRGLESITIPANVRTIGTDAFRYCDNLTSVIIPNNSQLTTIGFCSFLGCRALTSITLPASLTSIDMAAFKSCTGLTAMTCNATTPPAVNSSETFYEINRSIPIYVPVSAIDAYKEADYWNEFTNFLPMGTFGDNLTWMLTAEGELIVEGTGVMPDYTQPWSEYKQSIKTITVGEGITVLGSAAFSGCGKCTEVNLPNSLTDIRYEAFFVCSSLPSITLPPNVKTVGGRVFCDCGSLASVTLNEGLESLGGETFRACGALKSIEIPSSMKEIAGSSFYECKHLASVTIPEGVQKIASGAFCYCNDMASLTLPASLTSIGGNAFKQCVKLAYIEARATTPPTIEGSDAFTEVDKNVPVYVPASSVEAYKAADYWSLFANILPMGICGDELAWKLTAEGELIIEGTGTMTSAPWSAYTESIEKITIKEGVTSICDRAFNGCNKVVTVTIPKGVTEVGMDAFWDCAGILYLNSMPVVTGDYMMMGCFSGSRFTKVVISDDITEIGDWTFSYMTSLTEVVLPENLQRIGEMAFSCCRNITTITIPENVTTIGNWAFEVCEGLTSIVCKTATPPQCGYDVFYAVGKSIPLYVSLDAIDEYQSAEQWEQFTCIVGTAECSETLTGELWPDGKLIVKGEGAITTAPWEAHGEQVKELVFEEGVTGIADESFVGFDNLLSITSYAENPPVCSADAFDGVAKTTPVYVLPDKLEDYSVADGWREFIYLTSNDSRVLLDSYTEYSCEEDKSFEEITYVRTFNNTNWQALYVPFEIPVTEEFLADFEVADLNDIRQYDRDDDGVKDETAVEAFKVTSGTLKANYPYLIRAKEAGEKTIIVADATLYTTEENSIDCSSVHEKYTFTGTYSTMDAAALTGCYALSGGVWQPVAEDASLGAFRFYLKIESRDGNAQAAQSIKMRIIGENGEEDTTGIENSELTIQNSELIFDLQGRRVENPTKGVYIVNGKKVLY